MLDITILYNKSNPFGIQRDVDGLKAAISGLHAKIREADPLEPPVPSDLAIHLEIPIYAWMPWSTQNILMVNPEWYEPEAWGPYMSRFDKVIYKDPTSMQLAIDKGWVIPSQAILIPWALQKPTFSKNILPKGSASTGFVWFIGGSKNKRAAVPQIVASWREEYPPLRIYSVEPIDLSGVTVASNVKLDVRDLKADERYTLSSFFRGHICCSAAEGFGYTAAEAEWHGAFTILNDLPCYRADYDGQLGVMMLPSLSADLSKAIAAFESADLSEIETVRKEAAAERWDRFTAAIQELVKVYKPSSPSFLPKPLVTYPPISVVTLLYNRRKFFELACHNMILTDYPKDKIEWIIVEDSDDPAEGASDRVIAVAETSAPLKIVYVPLQKKTAVAAKRNIGVEKATNDIILMMDDDDHYPASSFRRRVSWLLHHWNPKAVAATTIACYDLVKGISAVNAPPLGIPLGQRISEATLTFYKSWWSERKFPAAVQIGEAEDFVKGREADLLEIPPQQIIVAFSHGKNVSSRRIPSGDEIKPGCFWGFPKEFLIFIHGLAGIKVVTQD